MATGVLSSLSAYAKQTDVLDHMDNDTHLLWVIRKLQWL